MKKLLFLLGLCAALKSEAQQVLAENFLFTGALTANGWIATSAGGTNPIAAATPGLTYAGYHASNIGGGATLISNGEDLKKDFTTADTLGKTYGTLMVNVKTASITGDYFCGFTSGATGTNYPLRLFVRNDSTATTKIIFGITRSNGTPVAYSSTLYDLNTTYLITVVYENVLGLLNDVCRVYVHPVGMVASTEPTTWAASYSGATGPDASLASPLNAFFVRQGATANNVSVAIDGIHVGKSWASTFLRSSVAEYKSDDLKLYPTLAKDVLNLEITKSLGAADVQIVNMTGQVVLAKKLSNTEGVISLPIGDLAVGSYIVRLFANGRELTQRFEKQ